MTVSPGEESQDRAPMILTTDQPSPNDPDRPQHAAAGVLSAATPTLYCKVSIFKAILTPGAAPE
jgi:hypothetical protein